MDIGIPKEIKPQEGRGGLTCVDGELILA